MGGMGWAGRRGIPSWGKGLGGARKAEAAARAAVRLPLSVRATSTGETFCKSEA